MKNRISIKKNMILNVLKTLMSIVFPLITYPYATRVLGVENFGKINYSNSIITYIALIAGLGISSYAIREGGFYRSNQTKLEKFASEVFSINIFTTIFSYICLAILIYCSTKIHSIAILLIIQSFSIICTTLGIDWMNVIYEDYEYITIRSFLIQIFSLLLLFLFVKNENDYYLYAVIQILCNMLISVLNWIHIRKKCKINVKLKCNFKKHFLPIIILFSNSLAVSIYLNSDNVMIGWMIGEFYVGIYAVSVKIYTILKQLVAAIYNVAVTRISEYVSQNKEEDLKRVINMIVNNIIIIAIPITIGLICTSKTIVYFVAGENYMEATLSLKILASAILFAVVGGMLSYCINLPYKREKINLIATSVSAVENIILNIFFIPRYGINGAAFTTLLSELTVLVIEIISIKSYYKLFYTKKILINITKCVLASTSIIVVSIISERIFTSYSFYYLIFTIMFSIILYCSFNLILKNEIVFNLFNDVKSKFKIRKEE